MDLQIDICNDIDENEWNSVVYNSKDGSIFHTIDWVNLFEKEYGEKVLIGAWLNGKLVGVFPSIVGGREIFPKHIRSFMLGYDLGGPVSINTDPQIIKEMICKFEEIAKTKANKATIVVPCNGNGVSEFEGVGFSKRLESTFIVDLKKPVDELWNNLDKSARKSVRKANKSGLSVRLAEKRSEIETYYDLFLDTTNKAGLDLGFRSKNFYYNIWDKLHAKGLAKIFFIEYNDEIIAGSVNLVYKKTIIGFCTGMFSDYRAYQPSSLLYWHIIEWGNKNGFEYLDLGGGLYVPSLYQFKKKWGGELNHYYIFTKTYPSLKYKLLQAYYGIRRPLHKLKKRIIKNEIY
ncbi:MAG: lipid II:glycine glycyltransferase FemX [Promethearchaeota archaeon]